MATELEEEIEFFMLNKDIWKKFLSEPPQNLINCLFINMEIKINEVLAKTHFFSVTIVYELDNKKKTSIKKGRAVVRINQKIQSVNLIKKVAAL